MGRGAIAASVMRMAHSVLQADCDDKGTAIFAIDIQLYECKIMPQKDSTFVAKTQNAMRVYDYLCQTQHTYQGKQVFMLHIFCSGLKKSFLRYQYLLCLRDQFPSETHYHLVLDASIYFQVSHTVIYEDIRKMEFELVL